MRWLLAPLAVFAFSLSTAVAQVAKELDASCVEMPKQNQLGPLPQAKAIGAAVDAGNLWIAEVDGDYARGNTVPRREVAQRFYQNHPDEFDFLVVFTGFEFSTGSATAFYNSIKNDVDGIGQPRFDFGAAFSSARLQGYIDMAALSRYALNAADTQYDFVLNTLAHEVMHRWGTYVHYRNSAGSHSADMIGQEQAHWSYFLDSDASLMYGSDWQQASGGMFRAVDVRHRFSDLDLYLAGFRSADEVAPFELIRDGSGDANALPRLDATTPGHAERIEIAQIVAAEGPRNPSVLSTQKEFRAAFIVLHRPGTTLDPQALLQLERLRVDFQQRFAQLTDGRATLRIAPAAATALPSLPTITQGSGSAPSMPGASAALAWLRQHQYTDGHWQDTAESAVRDTVAAVHALRELDPGYQGLGRAQTWLAARSSLNLESTAQRLAGLDTSLASDMARLIATQRVDGSWAMVEGFEVSAFDTASISSALAMRSLPLPRRDATLAFLGDRQRADGAFPALGAHQTLLSHTTRVLAQLQTSGGSSWAGATGRARTWVAGKQFSGGGFGDRAPTVYDSAAVLGASGQLDLSGLALAELRTYLHSNQQRDGDWGGSVYVTAIAVLAMARDQRPNLIANAPILIAPVQPVDGESATLSAVVSNRGSIASPAVIARWYDGDPAGSGVQIGSDLQLASVSVGGQTPVTAVWDTTGKAGAHQIWLLVDAANQAAESSEDDNLISTPASVAAAGVQPDLLLPREDIHTDPAVVTTLPATIVVHGSARNLGTTAVNAARVRVTASVGGSTIVLSETTVSVPGRATVAFQLNAVIDSSQARALTLTIDPDAQIAESNEGNNVASIVVPADNAVDFEIGSSDIAATTGLPAVVGTDAHFGVRVRNRGTLDSPSANLRAAIVQDGVRTELGAVALQIAPGATVERNFAWRATAGNDAVFEVAVDPDNAVVESDESNNAASLLVPVRASTEANLTLETTTLTYSPNPALQGSNLVVQATVRNVGSGASSPFDMAVYDADPRQGGRRVASTTVAGLSGVSSQLVDLTIPELSLAGDVALYVVADDTNLIVEASEDDNLAVLSLHALSLPDVVLPLAGVHLTPTLPVLGQSVEARVTVSNTGDQIAQNIAVRMREGTPDAGVDVPPERQVASLAAGASIELIWNWTFGLAQHATAVSVIADPQNHVRETNEQNNRAVLPIDTQSGDLYASDRYLSPNGDGVRDATAIVARVAPATTVRIEIRSGAGFVVRRFDDLVTGGGDRVQAIWDGRDGHDRIVADGDYRVVVVSANGDVAGTLPLTVDTNRSSPLEAVDTSHGVLATLPTAFDGWRYPTGAASRNGSVFAIGRPAGSGNVPRGVYRYDTLLRALRPVVSHQWLTRYAQSLGVAPGEITQFGFSTDGQWLAFTLQFERGAPNAGVMTSVFRTRTDQTDLVELLADQVPRRFDQPFVAFMGTNTIVFGTEQDVHGLMLVDIDSHVLRDYRTLPQELPIRYVLADGLILGSRYTFGTVNDYAPAYFVPRDGAQPVVAFPALTSDYDTPSSRIVVNADGSYFVRHMVGRTAESVDLIETRTGTTHTLLSVAPDRVQYPGGSEMLQVRHLQVTWLERENTVVVVDGQAREVRRFDVSGRSLSTVAMSPIGRTGEYAPTDDYYAPFHVFATVRGEGNANAQSCAGDVSWRFVDTQHRFYDASTDSVYASTAEVVSAVYAGYGAATYTYEGIVDYQRADFEAGTAERLVANSAWPLRNPLDRTTFPFAGPCQLNRPADWPRWILSDGSRTRFDGKIQIPGSASAPQRWTIAGSIIAVWPDETRLTLDDADHVGSMRRVFSSMLNLPAALVAEQQDRAVLLTGIAADRNFDHYEIEWSNADTPEQWNVLVAPAREEVLNEEFLTWVPPVPGDYLLRLRVVDKAGNESLATSRASSAYASPLQQMTFEPRYLSPNGDGVQDELIARFEVTQPANVDFVITDAQRRVVRTIARVYGGADVGPHELRWDGRTDGGQVVPDGAYRLFAAGWGFSLRVDTAAPRLVAMLDQAYHAQPYRASEPLPPEPVFSHPLSVASAATGIAFDVRDPLIASVRLETHAFGGVGWTTIREDLQVNELEPDRPALLDGVGDQAIALAFDEFAGSRFRLTATDLAGNRVVVETDLGQESQVLTHVQRPTRNGARASYQVRYQDAPFDQAPAPEVRRPIEFGTEASTPLYLEQGGQDSIVIANIARGIAHITVETAAPDSPGHWTVQGQAVTDGSSCIGQNCVQAQTHDTIAIPMPLADVPVGTRLRFRTVGTRGDGSRLVSNQFIASVGGIELFGNGPLDLSAQSTIFELVHSAPMAGPDECGVFAQEFISGPLRSAVLAVSRGGSIIRYPAAAISDHGVLFYVPATVADSVGQVEAIDARDRAIVSRTVSLAGQCGGLVAAGGGGGAESELKITPVIDDLCGSASTHAVRLKISTRQSSSAITRARARYRDPNSGESRIALELGLSSSPEGGQGFYGEALLDTAGWPEGRVLAFLDFQRGDVWSEAGSKPIPVDHTPISAHLDTPGDGQRICSLSGTDSLIQIEGEVRDASQLEYRVEIGKGLAPDAWECIVGGSRDGGGGPRNGQCTPFVQITGIDGSTRIGNLGNVGPLYEPFEGPATIRLRGSDWSGAMVCDSHHVFIDSSADLTERAPATRRINGELVLPLGLSTSGASEHRAVKLFLSARERMDVVLTLHRATQVSGHVQTDPAVLATLDERLAAFGAVDFEWDGRVAGAAMADGLYTVRATASDDCGWSKHLDYPLIIDATPPELNVTVPASGATIDTPVLDIRGTVIDPRLSQWQIFAGMGAGPASWETLATETHGVPQIALLGRWARGTNEGPATLRLIGKDSLGNESELRVPVTLAVPGNLIATAGLTPGFFSPNGDGVKDSLRLSYTLLRAASVSVAVRNGAGTVVAQLVSAQSQGPGTQSLSWDGRNTTATIVLDGDFTVAISVIDAANSSNSQSVELGATVDNTIPEASVLAPAGAFANGDVVTALSATDANFERVLARLIDVGSNSIRAERTATVPGSFDLRELSDVAEGRYRIEAEAFDLAGNRRQVSSTFTLDRTLPVATLTAPEDGAVLARNAVVAIHGTASDANLERYTLELAADGTQDWTLLASGTDNAIDAALLNWAATPTDGAYLLRLRAIDRAANSAERVVVVVIDGTAPSVDISSPADNAFVTRLLAVFGTALDDYLREYRLSIASAADALADQWSDLFVGTDAVSDDLLGQALLSLPDGDYILRLRATDQAGHDSDALRHVNLDTQPPSAPLSLSANVIEQRDVRLDWSPSSSSDTAGYAIHRDGERLNAALQPGSPYVDRNAPEGRLRYRVLALDGSGNESPPSNAVEVLVDRTAPAVAISAPTNGDRVHGRVTVLGTAYSSDDFKEFRLSAEPLAPAGPAGLLLRSSVPRQVEQLFQWDTHAYPEDSRIRLRLEAEDRAGNVASTSLEVVVDNLAPAVPSGLQLALNGHDAALQWNPNSESDLLGYLLYRDGQLVTAGGGVADDLRPFAVATTQYLDRDLGDGEHQYRLRAIDRAGNFSALSAPVSVSLDLDPPDLDIVAPEGDYAFETNVRVLADSSDRDVADVQFAYRPLAGTWVDLASPVSTRPWELLWTPAALPYGQYEIRATGHDLGGRVDPLPPVVLVRYADLTPPPAVETVRARADGNVVDVTWAAVTISDLLGYRVERASAAGGGAWQSLNTTEITGLSYRDEALTDNDYLYRVIALDRNGNQGAASVVATTRVFIPNLDQPYTPIVVGISVVEGSSQVLGQVSSEIVVGASIAAGPNAVVAADGRFVLNAVALASGSNEIRVRVEDADGNRSRWASVFVDRGVVPGAPTGVQIATADHTNTVAWTANPEPDVVGYRVFRNDSPIDPDRALIVGAVVASSNFDGDVAAAVDGNTATSWRPQAGYAPDAPAGMWLQLDLGTAQLVTAVSLQWANTPTRATDLDLLAWNGRAWVVVASQRGNQAAETVVPLAAPYRTSRLRLMPLRAPRAGADVLSLSEAQVIARPLHSMLTLDDTVIDGRYRYRVSAVNTYAFEGARSAEVTADIGDIIAPDAPALSGSVDGSDATLTWTASVASDVARYELRRDGAVVTSVLASAERRVLDARLPNGDYSYVIRAYDAFENASAASNAVVLHVATQGPGTPVGLRVTAPAVGSALDLSWTAAAGASPTQYVVRRSTAVADPFGEVARVSSPSARDMPLTNGTTYYYTVEALDAAGNRSAPSSIASGTPVDRAAPTAPALTHPTVPGFAQSTLEATADVCGLAEPGAQVGLSNNGLQIATVDAASGALSRSQEAGWFADRVMVSGDGRYASMRRNGDSQIQTLATGTVGALTGLGNVMAWVPGRPILYNKSADFDFIERYDARTGDRSRLNAAVRVDDWFAIAPDEGTVLSGDTSRAGVVRVDDGQRTAVSFNAGDPLRAELVEWSPASNRLAGVLPSGNLVLIDRNSGALTPLMSQLLAKRPRWSPEGRDLLVARSNGARTELVAITVASSSSRTLLTLDGGVVDFDWSPSADRIAVLGGGAVRVFDAVNGTLLQDLVFASPVSAQLQWYSTQNLVVTDSTTLALYRPAGAFCQSLTLRNGTNTVGATARDAAGNTSLPSAMIEIDATAQVALPDLIVTASDIRFLPASGAPGRPYSATYSLRNRGDASAAPTRVSVVLATPDGHQVALDHGLRTPTLDAGQSLALTVALGVLQSSGSYRLEITIDPDNTVTEYDETNNRASGLLILGGDGRPVLEVSADQGSFAPGAAATGRVSIVNPGSSFSGRMRSAVIDAQGAEVVALADEHINGLGFGVRWERALSWSAAGVLAGEYRFQADLLDAGGARLDRQFAAFAIQAVRQIDLGVTSDSASYIAGASSHTVVGINFAAGNAPLNAAQLELKAVAADGSIAWQWQRALGSLYPGYELAQTADWDTSGASAGVYRLVAKLSSGEFVRQAERTVSIVASANNAALLGSIVVAPSTNLILGGAVGSASYSVRNAGTAGAVGVSARLRLLDVNTIVSERTDTVDLAVGADSSATLELTTSTLGVRDYLLTLEARLPGDASGQWRLLAQQSVRGVDGLAPDIAVAQPSDGAVRATPTAVVASVTDRHSQVDRVELRVDDGNWQNLALLPNGYYGRTLSQLIDGPHRLSLRARDTWGNEVVTADRAFSSDSTAPIITILGVAEGDIVNHAVTGSVQIADANPDRIEISLDSVPYVAGTSINAEGGHVLRAVAVDIAGNRSETTLHFSIDRTAPTIGFVQPGDGASFNLSAIDVDLTTEALAQVVLEVGVYSVTVDADATGVVHLIGVPLTLGTNTLRARATDRAQNTSAPATIQITRISDINAALAGDLQPSGPSVDAGDPLVLAVSVLNRSGVDRAGQGLRVRVIAPDSQTVLGEQSLSHDFVRDENFRTNLSFATIGWPLGQLTTTLEAHDGTLWVVLDAEAVALADGLPPTLQLVAPIPDSVTKAPTVVRAHAVDALSGIGRVEASIDGAAWLTLNSSAGGNDNYESTALALGDGAHQIALQAADGWNNLAAVASQSFVIDNTTPAITIAGVADGELRNAAVTPVVQIVEPHLDQTTIRLNGDAFVSGTPVVVDGSYTLDVQASDRAGNTAQTQVHFAIDTVAPLVQFDSPAPGAVVLADSISVVGRTEGNATVRLESGAFVATATAGSDGVFAASGVPLTLGVNTVRARATDLATNVGAFAEVTVNYQPNAGLTLAATIAHTPAEVPHGSPLTVDYSARNTGTTAAHDLAMRVLVRAPGAGTTVVQSDFAISPAAGASAAGNYTYVTASWPHGDLQLLLMANLTAANGSSQWTEVASTPLHLGDRTAPLALIDAPSPGSYLRGDVAIVARVSDAASAIARVEARVGTGAWVPLNADAAAPGRYVGTTTAANEGAQSLELRAFDAAGNLGSATSVPLNIDRTPPAINVSGLPADGVTNQAVAAVITSNDASPTQVSATLNRNSYQSGTVIATDGSYRLVAAAVDAAGNSSARSFEFVVDRTAPVIVVSHPVDAATMDLASILVTGGSEAGATVVLRVGSYLGQALADARGDFHFEDVPLVLGSNTLTLSASDRAANLGATVSLRVTRRAASTQALEGHFALPGDSVHRGDALIASANLQNTGTTGLTAVPIRMTATRVSGAQILDHRTAMVDLGAGLSRTVAQQFETATWPAGSVRLELAADLTGRVPAVWMVLDQQTVVVTESAVLSLAVLEPLNGSSVGNSTIDIVAATAAGATVSLQRGADHWESLAGSSGTAVFARVPLQPGNNDFSLVARNVAGNQSSPVALRVVRQMSALAATPIPALQFWALLVLMLGIIVVVARAPRAGLVRRTS